jgi:hypothetical protein
MEVFKGLCDDGYDARIEDILLLPATLKKRAPWLDPAVVFGAYGVHSQDEAAHVCLRPLLLSRASSHVLSLSFVTAAPRVTPKPGACSCACTRSCMALAGATKLRDRSIPRNFGCACFTPPWP